MTPRAATGPTATRQAYAVPHAILATAVADDALPPNPCRTTGAGQARSDERPLLDVDQVQHLSAHMPENLRGLVDLAFWAHLRLGELLALRIGDIDMDAGTIAVQRQVVETDAGPVESPPKAGSQRVVHLPPRGVSALAEHLETAPRRCRLLGCSCGGTGEPSAPITSTLPGAQPDEQPNGATPRSRPTWAASQRA